MDERIVRPIFPEEFEEAIELSWKTFEQFQAPDYSPEGIKSFLNFIYDPQLKQRHLLGEHKMWGCFIDDKLVGVIAMREPCHINLLFVDSHHHDQKIGRDLVKTVLKYAKEIGAEKVTLHSASYALDFYRHMGFVDTDCEQTVDGIIFTPMQYVFSEHPED